MSETDLSQLPQPEVRAKPRGRPSLIWLVPIVAALIGIALVVRAVLSAGTMITISFASAEGLEAGVTEVRYKDVVVGKVRSIALSDDLQSVIVAVEMDRSASRLAVADTRFWVVRPRIDTGGISGLGTLLSGVYISMDVGKSIEAKREFQGLDKAPAVSSDQQGTSYVLRSADLGSLGVGSPVYFHRIPVGRIGAYELDPDGHGVTLQLFVEAPYDRFVTPDTRFWNASGVEVSLSASGLQVNTESLATVVAGGVAFLTPEDGQPAPAGTTFWLREDKASALSSPSGAPVLVRMHFAESLRGLTVGAPVDFRGVALGTVKSVEMQYDTRRRRFVGEVVARVFPKRLGKAYDTLAQAVGDTESVPRDVVARLVHDGLQAQLQTGSLLTGQLFVAFDIKPGTRAPVKLSEGPRAMIEIPTQTGSLSQLQTQVGNIVDQLSRVPFADIGTQLRTTLTSANSLLQRLDGELAPEAAKTLVEAQKALESANQGLLSPNSGTQQDLRQTLGELQRAGRSLRDLTDYLQRHPEALIRGKGKTPEPQAEESKP